MKLSYATRRSALALAQSRAFVAKLASTRADLALEEVQIVTTGDKIQDRPLSEVGGKGLFVKEIEEALLSRRADLAIHSIKDVPGILPPGLVIACIPEREDARDVLISPRYGTLSALPEGAKVGTSSLRRAVCLLRARPDLQIVPLRGNVDTRLRSAEEGRCDAIVLARAGLVRLGLEDRVTELLAPELSLPAVGQGALGIECREDDEVTRELLARVHDATTSMCVTAERAVLIALEGDCKTPLGAYARRVLLPSGEASLLLRAFVSEVPGAKAPEDLDVRFAEESVAWPKDEAEARALGDRVGNRLAS